MFNRLSVAKPFRLFRNNLLLPIVVLSLVGCAYQEFPDPNKPASLKQLALHATSGFMNICAELSPDSVQKQAMNDIWRPFTRMSTSQEREFLAGKPGVAYQRAAFGADWAVAWKYDNGGSCALSVSRADPSETSAYLGTYLRMLASKGQITNVRIVEQSVPNQRFANIYRFTIPNSRTPERVVLVLSQDNPGNVASVTLGMTAAPKQF